MKRTLIIAPKYPLPENDGASMRTMNFVRYFGNHGEVEILCKRNCTDPLTVDRSVFSRVHFIDQYPTLSRRSHLERAIDKLVRLKSWSNNYYSPENEELIRKIVADGGFDFILCRYLTYAYPLLHLEQGLWDKVILDVDDIITDTIYDAEHGQLTGIARLARTVDKLVLKRYSNRCMRFGSILFCSETDRSKLAGSAVYPKSYVVPNTYHPSSHLTGDNNGYPNINHLLFVGSLSYTPNLQGILWFISEVFSQAREKFQDLKLSVVGRNPPEELRSLVRQYPEIELHPNVPDVGPFYQICGISVVPLLAGGGTRIKILESGFARRPVMSTEIGAYGLGMTDGKEVMIFNDSRSFIEKYQRLRGDRGGYLAMTGDLSRFVLRNFSFDNFQASMDTVVRDHLTEPTLRP